ncbi:MAG: 1-deoxy-D-xylulose-5-phosphate synthase [Gracilimonas sp.]|uniref:1-deoxy-D-xylulose-5-phosphate synthase n=1 Tax=Gracilimonas TaxID=649462 RepID=UPI001B101125|nr:1-deoxy-D-xylulose-5-phosphate synthase [Gracilimonas sp.]MBO6584741.1 1-deoxy-D-xylulose-5-phosphate synthase [Gracilimonas sp.]MBO6615988.1 1-deoxy-D-xylulose-5-phosphate synthase [Gracilimonas sp.]
MEQKQPKPGKLLAQINSPSDLKKLEADQLQEVCDELRQYIIDMVSVHGGHFGASLGVVELTTALHYVYDTPKDLLVWDVGHQAYGHKILTGRREQFHTNRIYGGLSGFPKRSESEYDTFGVGHSSTSISAALGMAVARDLDQSDKKVVAVIGDGAMTAGLAFEAMNNAGAMNSDILVILNDNNMSIDPNVGALKEYLADITTSKTFNKMRDEVYDMLGHFKSAGEKMRKVASRLEKAMTAALTPGSLFRSLGFKYYGPVDGHDVDGLRRMLEDLKDVKGPKLLHAVTVKGKGFAPAEREQTKWHASSSPFDKITGKSLSTPSKPNPIPKYQDVFGDALVELAEKDERIVSMTPAMPSGSSLWPMMNTFPERAFDVGIAEQHAVTFAAGLAAEGKKAFCAIYSSFLQRGYDQLVHDVAIQNLPVVFCIDRAGLVGADGPTHHGAYDTAYMRAIPNMIISSPLNEQDLRDMMYTASKYDDAAWAIRYPRGRATGMDVRENFELIEIGKGIELREGEDIAILSFGPIGKYVFEAADQLSKEGLEIGHYDMRYAKPLDTELIDQVCNKYSHIITLEDGSKMGGFGSAVAEYIADKEDKPTLKIMGIPDRIVEHGTQEELHDEIGIGVAGIIENVKQKAKVKV